MDLTNPQVTLRQARIEELEAELAKEREKVKELERRNVGFSGLIGLMQTSLEGDTARIGELLDELAAERKKVQHLQFALADTEALECGTAERLAAEQAKVTRLEADVQRLQKLKEDYGPTMVAMQKQAWAEADRQSQINRLSEQLAAAQATIAEMREALTEVVDADECQDADGWLCFELSAEAYHRADAALSIQCNQDALHEARALECERLAETLDEDRGMAITATGLRKEAAAHRARKEGK